MNAKILNRDFQHPSDGWYQIEPKGDHLNKAAKVIQVIDDEAVLQIVNRFNADADQPGFAGMLIDHEHFKHDAEKETRAYGWLMRLANRDDGIYGQIKWTGTGKPAVDSGDYRYFSTEYDPADLKVLNATGALRRIRPMRLDGLTLTNSPNNRGGRPITNRTEAGATNLADANAAAANQTTNERTNTMKSIATKLGLAAEASEDAILASVTNLMNRAAEAEGKITPLNTEIGTLKNRNTELETEQCYPARCLRCERGEAPQSPERRTEAPQEPRRAAHLPGRLRLQAVRRR